MMLSKNFHVDEFECRDGNPVPKRYLKRAKELADNLEVLRAELGKPIKIMSAYRTPAYNKKVGGVKRSQHIQMRAVDIQVRGVSPKKVYWTIIRLIKEGKMKKGGLGLYGKFVHYDTRGFNARWCGS